MTTATSLSDASQWTIERSRALYHIPAWTGGYFDIGANGHLLAQPQADANSTQIDLYQLAEQIQASGLPLPVLVRFTDILKHRVDSLCGAFNSAIKQHDYGGRYTAVYPIKVNQQRRVVEEIINHGGERVGLEAGSKPELLYILALAQPGTTIICNGYKDREYIQLALTGRLLGLNTHIVIEKLSELELVIQCSRDMDIKPLLGMRLRLASVGAGKWQNSGGEKSKFGLQSGQVLQGFARLQQAGLADCLQLMHFHIGSQVTDINQIQRAIREGTRFYAELRALGAPLTTVDVGGGLGVDYEGTGSRNPCSMNYTVSAYADAVVRALAEIIAETQLPSPNIITESGRAMTAHHAMLITNVIDVDPAPGLDKPEPPGDDEPLVLHDLWQILASLERRSALPCYYAALNDLERAREMFNYGVLDIQQRARAEAIFYYIARQVQRALKYDEPAQREVLDELNERLADKYFCNFSLFQSLPDSWAIDQVFPIVPLHRLQERPNRRGMIEDLTCDSDGRVDLYVDGEGIETSLPLHAPEAGKPYLLGIFLLGAYQEILGDMHNLFGDTGSVNVQLTAAGGYELTEPHGGDTVADLLRYVNMDADHLRQIFAEKMRGVELPAEQHEQYLNLLTQGLDGYSYLEE
ncbi:MAG: biosynthetic arginine decarboxylase [Gammaproteobacteria bacterium]